MVALARSATGRRSRPEIPADRSIEHDASTDVSRGRHTTSCEQITLGRSEGNPGSGGSDRDRDERTRQPAREATKRSRKDTKDRKERKGTRGSRTVIRERRRQRREEGRGIERKKGDRGKKERRKDKCS